MKRIALVLGVTGMLVGSFMQPASASPAERRIIVVTVDGTSLSSWLRSDGLRGVVGEGATALLAARAGGDHRDAETARRAAYATLVAGRRTALPSDGAALADALNDAGVNFYVSPSWEPYLDGVPRRGMFDSLTRPSVYFVSASDLPECTDPTCVVRRARAAMQPGDVLMVVAAVPPPSRVNDGVWLSAAGIVVVGSPAGMLRSPTTRRDGVVALIDLAPTILSLADVRVPASMDGRPVERVSGDTVVSRLRTLESDLIQAAHARRPATRAWMIAAMIALAGAMLTGRRYPSVRVAAQAGLAAASAVPAALLLMPVLPPLSPGGTAVVALVLAAVAGVVARAFLRGAEAVAATAALSAILVLGDLLAGGYLAARSPVSYLIAGGLRFYGIGNELMGVVVAGAIAAGSLLDRARLRSAGRFGVPLAAAFAVGVMAAPSAGAKLGAVLVAVPALAVLVLGLAGRKMTLRLGIAIGAFTVLVAGVVSLADRLGSPAAQSHIGRATEGGIGDVVARKIDAALGIAALSIWMQALIACALVVALTWRFRRVEVQALAALRPSVGAALKAAGVAIILAPATNDAGLIASAVIAVTATALLLGALGAEPGVRRPGSQAGPGSGGPAPARPG
jgi:hypothetical protein